MPSMVSTAMGDLTMSSEGNFSQLNQPTKSTQPGHPSVGRHMEMKQVVTLCYWGVKAGLVSVWLQIKTLIPFVVVRC